MLVATLLCSGAFRGAGNVMLVATDRASGAPAELAAACWASKLVLVAAVMAKLNVERVEYHETNGSCLGVLLHEPFWE